MMKNHAQYEDNQVDTVTNADKLQEKPECDHLVLVEGQPDGNYRYVQSAEPADPVDQLNGRSIPANEDDWTTLTQEQRDELMRLGRSEARLRDPEDTGMWTHITNLQATLFAAFLVLCAITVCGGLLLLAEFLGADVSHLGARAFDFGMNQLTTSLGLRNAWNLDQVLPILPWAVLGCVGTTAGVGYVYKQSTSRRIDWTDNRLLLEHDGPYSAALKWSSIATVDQAWQWEPFHGRQPVFVVTTHMGKKFRLRLSDLTQKRNIGEFFSLIKTNAPDAVLNVDRNFASDNSFTELWLKYFSVPAERERTGLLQHNMLLDHGRYKIVGTVGGGGQGTAYLGEFNCEAKHPCCASSSESLVESAKETQHIMDPDDAGLAELKQVVLKEYVLPIHRGQLTTERTTEKLKGEAEILRSLRHPQIVRVLDAFIEDYRGYLVLEYVEGQSLKSMVERFGPQPEKNVIEWAIDTCGTLAYLHGLSPPVVHRDITPDNLMLQESGRIKLVDFNVAYQVDSSATATVVGKHAYIPAEQFRGKPTPQSDIYALGCSMFFLLTGQEPEPITVAHPHELNKSVSAEIDRIVAKATQSALKDRFQTVDELADAIGKLLES